MVDSIFVCTWHDFVPGPLEVAPGPSAPFAPPRYAPVKMVLQINSTSRMMEYNNAAL